MLRLKIAIALGLSLAAAGIYRAYAQQKPSAITLTALDYGQIEQLYATYNHAIDFGEADGRDYAALYVPDGVFVNVVPASTPASCQARAPWHAADRAVISGSIADKRGTNMCITTLNGSQDLADMAKGVHAPNTLTSRHTNANLQITPTSDGATGFTYLVQFNAASTPPTLSPSGFYQDTLVKTAAGWRFKKRIRTEDAVVVKPRKP